MMQAEHADLSAVTVLTVVAPLRAATTQCATRVWSPSASQGGRAGLVRKLLTVS